MKNFFFFVAMAAVMTVGCGKDDDTTEAVATAAGQNELVMDGVKYAMNPHAQIDSPVERIYLDVDLASDEGIRVLRADVEASSYNRTFDLSRFE